MRRLRFTTFITSLLFAYPSYGGSKNFDEIDRDAENGSADSTQPEQGDIALPDPNRTESEEDPGTEEGAFPYPPFPHPESSDDFVPGRFYYGVERLIQYRAGNLPIIIVAPHGGKIKPTDIIDRTSGVLTTDLNTYETASSLYYAIYRRTGRFPHVISCKIARIKLDCNRALEEATLGDVKATKVWKELHGFIGVARNTVLRDYGRGIYIEIHGHGHPIQRLELGYQLGNEHLMVSDNELDTLPYINRSTIREIAIRTGIPFSKIVRGPQSFGSALEDLGVAAVPSHRQPNSGDQTLFNGGYNVVRYGSRDGGSISAIQIESQYYGIRDSLNSRHIFAEKLTSVLQQYVMNFFDISL